MKNRDGSDSNVKFVDKTSKKKTKQKKDTPVPKTADRGMVSNEYKKSLAIILANSAAGFKGLTRLSDQDISRQFSIARGVVKKTNPVAKGFAQDKRIRADKAKEKKAFSKKK